MRSECSGCGRGIREGERSYTPWELGGELCLYCAWELWGWPPVKWRRREA